MSCGLSRNELKAFKISLSEDQRCQATTSSGTTCNSYLSEHPAHSDRVPHVKDSENDFAEEEELYTSSCLGRFGKRFLHASQFVILTYMAILCFLVLFISGLNFEVSTAAISNLSIDPDVDALRFWFRTNKFGFSAIEYYEPHHDQDAEVKREYVYSSQLINSYECGEDLNCDETVDDLTAAWNTLVLASSVSAVICVVSWFLAAPRLFYPVFHSTSLYKNGLKEENPIFVWFLKPIGLTYVLTLAYAVVYAVQFLALFRYTAHLPSNEDMYRLSLHYINNDSTLCSSSSPCDYEYDSIGGFSRNYAFFIVAQVFAFLAVLVIATSHRLKLISTRWMCLNGYCKASKMYSTHQAVSNDSDDCVQNGDVQNEEMPQSSCPELKQISASVIVADIPMNTMATIDLDYDVKSEV